MAAAIVERAAPGSIVTLLVVVTVVLGLFWVGGGVVWLLGRAESEREMAAGREARRHADEVDNPDLESVVAANVHGRRMVRLLNEMQARSDLEADR